MKEEIARLAPSEQKKIKSAWTFYDWANSVYPLVITTAIFPLYYEEVTSETETITLFGHVFNNTALYNYIGALGFLIVCIISPILSGIADYMGNKKSFLKLFCYLGSISCMGLFFFDVHSPAIGFLFFIFASVGFWGSLVFYNSYLPDIAPAEEHDALSAKGFSLGYIGSVLLLVACLAMIMKNDFFGLDVGTATKLSFILTGIWWIGFSQITYARLPEIRTGQKYESKILLNGHREIYSTFLKLLKTSRLKAYLKAFFVYSMGVQTVMLAAVLFAAKEVNWGEGEKSTGLIVSVLLIQIIAIVGAQGMSYLSSKIGNLNTLKIIVGLWVVMCIAGYFVHEPIEFYVVAAFVGLVMGGTQSLSRSTYAKFIPPKTKDTTSFFSFYDVSEKVGLIFGLFIFGLVEDLTGDMRLSILSLMVFFIVGFILILLVPKNEKEDVLDEMGDIGKNSHIKE